MQGARFEHLFWQLGHESLKAIVHVRGGVLHVCSASEADVSSGLKLLLQILRHLLLRFRSLLQRNEERKATLSLQVGLIRLGLIHLDKKNVAGDETSGQLQD